MRFSGIERYTAAQLRDMAAQWEPPKDTKAAISSLVGMVMNLCDEIGRLERMINDITAGTLPPHSAPEPISTKTGYILDKRNQKLKGWLLNGFLVFWEVFDYKENRADAAWGWTHIKWPSGKGEDTPENQNLLKIIILAARKENVKRDSEILEGKTPKMGQGWLSSRRWENYEEEILSGQMFKDEVEFWKIFAKVYEKAVASARLIYD